jgi:intein/homing endonuclease
MAENKKESRLIYVQDEEELHLELAKKALVARGIPEEKPSFSKSIINILNGQGTIERLAFEADPSQINQYAGVYKAKMRLIPDTILKRIAIQDSLVANIVRARQNHIASFGRPRPDRFSLGYLIKPNTGLLDKLDEKGKKELQKEIQDAIDLFSTCGNTKGIVDEHQATFAEYLSLSTRSAIVCGRIATEIVWAQNLDGSDKPVFHHFVATDSGTIYPATHNQSALQSIRDEAYNLLCRVTGQKLIREKFDNQEYSWVQVVDTTPKEVFTRDEMLVYNFFAVPDVEIAGFPVTPLDTVISAVTTHINITTLNKLWFQNGRASKGMLVIKSDDATPQTLHAIKQNFNASINNVQNSFRMPCFGCGVDEEIQWQSLDTGAGRDMEYQFLSDMNCREILTAFLMSPEELPGWSYLSRGTNSQALSECISPTSRIITEYGLLEIGHFVGDKRERAGLFWSGDRWGEGRAFKSGMKRLVETELACGVKLQTSPDHRFRVINECGELDWKHQSELLVGDGVLVSRKPVVGNEKLVPSFRGRKLTLEVMETLGWLTGDGCLVAERERVGAKIHLFYHQDKERDIWEKQEKILSNWGLKVHHEKKFLTEEEREEKAVQYGCKSIAPNRIRNTVYDTDFYRWLIDFGFQPSSRGINGKVIPAKLHVLPVPYRQAFLRGLFSADGGKLNDRGSVALTIQNDILRDQVRQLLIGLGIRTLPAKGYARDGFGGKRFSHKLFIKDREAFWNQVGFIQSWKQPDKTVESWSNDKPSFAVVKKCLAPCLSTPGFKELTKGVRDATVSILNGKKTVSYQFLRRIMSESGVMAPPWFDDYNIEPVIAVCDLGKDIEMFDVEMFDDVHAFVVDGVITHNSNPEFKLEAARDVGIRPLLAGFEDFINTHLFPLIAPNLVDKCQFKFVGLETDNAEKEAVRTQQDMQIWMTFDDVLERVEKKPMTQEWGGTLPLNQIYKSYLDQYFTVGQILEKFCGIQGASKDPALAYRRDPMFFQWYQMQQQMEMAKQQQAQSQQVQSQQVQPQQGQPGQPSQGQDQSDGQPSQDSNSQQPGGPQAPNGQSPQGGQGTELARSVDQAFDLLRKNEAQLPPDKRRLIAQQEKTVDYFVKGFMGDADEAVKAILEVAEFHQPLKTKP